MDNVTREMIKRAEEECEDKSTEYMIEYIITSCGVSHETVMEYLREKSLNQGKSSRNIEQVLNNNDEIKAFYRANAAFNNSVNALVYNDKGIEGIVLMIYGLSKSNADLLQELWSYTEKYGPLSKEYKEQ